MENENDNSFSTRVTQPGIFMFPLDLPFSQLCEIEHVVSHVTDVGTEDRRCGAEPLVSALISVLISKVDVEAQ